MKEGSSLRVALTRNYILIGLIPLLVIGLISNALLTRSLTEEITTKNHTLAVSISGEVQTFLTEPLSLMYQVGEVLSTKVFPTPDSISTYLTSVVNNYPFFEMVQFLNPEGRVQYVAPYDEAYLHTDMSRQLFFTAAKARNSPYWSPTFISMRTGSPTLTIAIPLQSGMAVGYLNLATLSAMVSRLSTTHQFAVIADNRGTVIADLVPQRVKEQINLNYLPAIQEGLKGTAGTVTIDFDNTKMLASIVPVQLTGWLVVFLQHHDDAFLPVTQIRKTIAIGMLLTALAAILIAIVGAQLSVRPLLALTGDAQRIADGDYTLSGLDDGYREIQQLHEYFNHMILAIMSREKNVLEREQQYRDLIELIPYGIQESDCDGIITFTNSSYDRIFDCESGAAIGRTIWQNLSSPQEQLQVRQYYAVLVAEQPTPTTFSAAATTDRGRQIEIQVDWQYKRHPDGSLKGFISVITDITEKKQLEESLIQAQKLEAIGTLAGGIAHDFNNILSAILGYGEMVLDTLPPGSRVHQEQQQIIKASHRARDLVKHLLVFSRKQQQRKLPVILHEVVSEAIQLLRATLPSTITFDLHLDPSAGIIEADPTQIHQVMINLCTNAAHAMEAGGGILTITLTKTPLVDDNRPVTPQVIPGEYAVLKISDTGHGIEPHHLQRIFEPFFTTKPTGKGTGMGLAVVHGIISSIGGTIAVNSEVGKGTTFTISFPLVNLDAAPVILSFESDAQGNGEHILVVDDEKTIVTATATILQRSGYRVTTATGSSEALLLFENDPRSFDLVITDQTMPGMTGFELSRRVLTLRPGIPILLCTGFSSVLSSEKALQAGIADYVMKPVPRQILCDKVASLLRKSASC